MKDPNLQSIKQKAKNSAFWSLLEKLGIQILSAIIGLMMTRLLLPSDYGMVAMLDIFIAIGLLISDSGLGQGFIHKTDVSLSERASLFTYNFGVGFLLFGCMFITAPWIALFYNEPRLIPIIQVFSLNIPLQAAAIIPQSVLMKELKLSLLTKVKLSSAIIAGVVGVYTASAGFGAWSIVLYITSYNALITILLLLFSGWRPNLHIKFHHIRIYSNYSLGIFAANGIEVLYVNFFTMFISKYYTASVAGLYAKARLLQNMPVQSTTQIIQNVAFPVLSRVSTDIQQFSLIFKRQLQVISFLLSAIMGTIIVTATPFVSLVLTDNWLPMVPYLQLLCVLGWLMPFHTLHITVLNAKGRSDLSYRIEVVKKVFAFLVIGLTFQSGVMAIIIGQILVLLGGLIFHVFYSRRFLQYSLRTHLADLFLPLILAAICTGIAEMILSDVSNLVLSFLSRTLLFLVSYFVLTFFVGQNQFRLLIDLVKEGMRKN